MINWQLVESEMRDYIKNNNLSSPELIMNNLKNMYDHVKAIPECGLDKLTYDIFVYYANEGLSKAVFDAQMKNFFGR